MVEGPRPSWEIVKQKADMVTAFPKKYQVQAMLMKAVPEVVKGKRADAAMLRKSLANPEGTVAEIVENSQHVIDGTAPVNQYAMLVVIGLNALALEQSFIVPSANKKK